MDILPQSNLAGFTEGQQRAFLGELVAIAKHQWYLSASAVYTINTGLVKTSYLMSSYYRSKVRSVRSFNPLAKPLNGRTSLQHNTREYIRTPLSNVPLLDRNGTTASLSCVLSGEGLGTGDNNMCLLHSTSRCIKEFDYKTTWKANQLLMRYQM